MMCSRGPSPTHFLGISVCFDVTAVLSSGIPTATLLLVLVYNGT